MGLSGREAAKQLGLTQPALVKAARTGRISREADGTYDVEKVRKQLAENSNALKRRQTAEQRKEAITEPQSVIVPITESDNQDESADRTLAEAQRRREWIRVQKDQLELARKKAELAPVGEINAFVAGMIIRARDILMRIAPELKDRLAQQSNPHECERLVDSEIRRALAELSEFRPTV